MTCTTEKVSGKTPIGIVSYINGSKRIAIQLDNPGTMYWTNGYTDISGITNYGSDSSPHITDFNGKSNTQAWVNYYGTSTTGNAPGYCYNYTTTGTSKGDWYLPAEGELCDSVYANKSSVNAGLIKAGGTTIVKDLHWSSSEYDIASAWTMNVNGGYVYYYRKDSSAYVRCVLEFEDNGDGTAKVCGADYAYTCTGEGESPIGESCGGKYIGCTTNCAVGDILNSDKTCTSDTVSGKTPIGIVSYVNGSTRIAVQLDNLGTKTWDYAGSYCNTYSKGGVSGWYLPTKDELYASVWTNKSYVNAGLSKAGGTAIVEDWHWSSSDCSFPYKRWAVRASDGYMDWLDEGSYSYVRCVLAF